MTTLGALYDLPVPEPFLEAVRPLIDSSLPQGWRDWRVNIDILREVKLDRNRLRFVIPMLTVVKLYRPGESSISEPRFKRLKAILCDWPLGRGLLIHLPTSPPQRGLHDFS